MKLHTLAALVALSAAGTTFAADEVVVTDQGVGTFSFFKPASVRAEISTLGYGGAVSYSVNPKTEVSLGYTGGDVSNLSPDDSVRIDGIEYSLEDSDFSNAQLMLQLRPFGGWFHTTFGTIIQNNEVNVMATPGTSSNDVRINGARYAGIPTNAMVRGRITFKNEIAPYIGFGFSPAITNRIGLFGEIGAAYMSPKVDFLRIENIAGFAGTRDGVPVSAAQLQADLNEASRNLEDDETYVPVAKVGLSLRF